MKIVNTITSDKLHLSGFLSEPKNSKENIIVHIHGMGGDPYTNKWYQSFHDLFPKNDCAFLVGNHRGTGSITMFLKDPDECPNYGNALEIFEDSVEDISAWVQFAKDLGYKNIFIQAHSLAPSKIVYFMNKKNLDFIKGLILISPVDMLGLTLINKELHERMLLESKKFINEGKGETLLSEKVDGEYYFSAKTYLNFFGEGSNCNVFCYSDRQHDWSMVNNTKVPVLGVFGTKDAGILPVSNVTNAQNIFKKQFKSSPLVKTVVIEGAEHSFDNHESEVVDSVLQFIQDSLNSKQF